MKPLLLTIDLASPVPAYRQIADGIRERLVQGVFAPGDQLPTVRQLAADLGVHHNTVAQAYRTLADEGWLDLARGRGATLRSRSAPKPDPSTQASLLRRLRELVAQARAAGVPVRALAGELDHLARSVRHSNGPRKPS